jgi:hypothetical protein
MASQPGGEGEVNKMNREIEQGKRTGLPPGYRFIPAGISLAG